MHLADHHDHSGHDPYLLAGHAAGDLTGAELATAERLLSTCTDCTVLHRDLISLAAASRSLPAPALPARDFRIDAAQAERLRRGSWLRKLLRPFASAGSSARPLAAAFTSVGVAGLLVAAFVPGMLGGAAGGGLQRDAATSAGQSPAAPVSAGAGRPGDQGPAASGGEFGVDPLSTSEPRAESSGEKDTPTESDTAAIAQGGSQGSSQGSGGAVEDQRLEAAPPASPSLVLIGSLGFLGVGLGLFALRMVGRRLDA